MKHSSLRVELSMQNVTVTVFEKLSLFSSTAFKSAKGDSFLSLPFITFHFLSFHFLHSRGKIQIHCRVLNGGPIPLKGLTAELHCSFRLYLLVAQGLQEPWGSWQGNGRLCSLPIRHYKTKICTVTSKTVCHANSTCCSWWRAHSAETQVWQTMSQLSSKSCIKPVGLSYTWVERLHSKKHWYPLELSAQEKMILFPLREAELQDAASQNIYYVLRNSQVHKLGAGSGSRDSSLFLL